MINGDTDVTARFDSSPPPPPPPAPASLTLDVQVNGQGTITSTPAGIDCGQACHASFTSIVGLRPTAQTGWHFEQWAGDCTGKDLCTFPTPGAVNRQVVVFATFAADPPPPPPDCDGIVPGNLGASVSATLPGNDTCGNQTSDGTGNVAADSAGHWYVFSPAGVSLRDYESDTAIPQGRGFQGIETRGSAAPPTEVLAMRNSDGSFAKETVLGAGNAPQAFRSFAGGSVVTSQTCAGGGSPGQIDIDRFDANGNLLDHNGTLGGCNKGLTTGVIDANDFMLLVFSGARDAGFGSNVVGRWFTGTLQPQAEFFAVANGTPRQMALRALIGGGVAVQADGTWIGVIAGGAITISPPPQWLSDNADHDFTVVRNNRAYAVLSRGAGDPKTMTLYSAQGNRCGTVTFPAGGLTTGVDGTVIAASGTNGCTKTWWPALLK
jgi:hypothetical protein